MKKKYRVHYEPAKYVFLDSYDVYRGTTYVCSALSKATAYKIARALNMMDDDGRLIRKLTEENRDLRNILREPGEC